jgi:hypothetical protein
VTVCFKGWCQAKLDLLQQLAVSVKQQLTLTAQGYGRLLTSTNRLQLAVVAKCCWPIHLVFQCVVTAAVDQIDREACCSALSAVLEV